MVRFIVFIFLFSSGLFAADLHLYDLSGKLKHHYIEILKGAKLKPGDRIYTSKDKYFIYEAELSEGQGGNSSKIYSVKRPGEKKSYALRLPFSENEKKRNFMKEFLDYYYEGYDLLKKQKVPIPEIIDYEQGKFILTEVIEHQFNFTEFVRNPTVLLPPEEIEEANKALDDFARKIAMFREIGDFHGKQIVYNKFKKSWTLLDFDKDHNLTGVVESSSPFKSSLFAMISLEDDLASEEEANSLRKRKRYYDEHLKQVVWEERRRLYLPEKERIEKYLSTYKDGMSKEDFIKYYSTESVFPNIGYFSKELYKHFHNNKEAFSRFTWTVEELFDVSDEIVKNFGAKVSFFSIALDQLDDPLEIDEFVKLYSEKYPEIYKNDKAVLTIQKFLKERLEKVRMSKECVDAIGSGLGI